MKVCPACGVQFDDAINFCSTCGSALAPVAPVASVAPVTPVAPVAPAVPVATVAPVAPVAPAAPAKPAGAVMGFISKLLTILSVMFIGCGLASAAVKVSVYLSSYTYDLNSYGYFRPDETCSIFAFLLALGALAMAIVSFIQTLVKKGGAEKVFAAIVRMVGAMATIIVSIVMMVNM